MCFIVPTKEIKELERKVFPYRSMNKRENRGDGFKEGTPDYILEIEKKINAFYDSQLPVHM